MSKGLLKSTTVVSSMTALSRVLGMLRDMVIAAAFGATPGADAFWVAFKIPNFMRRLFAEGAFSQAFVPVLAEVQQQQGEQQVQRFISHMLGLLGGILLLLTLLAVFNTPLIIKVFTPGFQSDPYRFSMAADMLQITFPYLLLISLTAFAGAVLNTYGSFAAPSFCPVLLNIIMIAGALYLAPYLPEPVTALAWAVFVAGLVQLVFLLPFLARKKLLPIPRISLRDQSVVRVLKLMLPALFGVSVAQINLLVDTAFASFLPTGSVSWLYYSDRLMNFPLGVFGVAMATVVLPHLARDHLNKGNNQEFSSTLDWAIRWILLIGVPAAIGLVVMGQPLLTTLFQAGKFGEHDVLMTATSLAMFAYGVPAFMLIKILASAFYAQKDIATPVKIGVVAMLLNIALNFLLIDKLQHAGLALATTLSAFLNMALLLGVLWRRGRYSPQAGWLRFWLQLLAANGSMLVMLYCASPSVEMWFEWVRWARLAHLTMWVSLAVLLYFAILWVAGLRWRDLHR